MLTRELAGEFVMYMYNNGFILGNHVAAKTFVQRKFKAFLAEANQTLGAFDNDTSLDAILKQFNFVCNAVKDEKIYKFDFRALFKYRNEVIAQMDQKTMKNANKAILATENYSVANITEDKPKILEDFPSYELIFQFKLRQTIKENFILSSKGCYCCQLNFQTQNEYGAHIDYHSQESDFEYRSRHKDESEGLPKQFTITYKICEKSHLLFSIKSLQNENIIIERIIVYRMGMVYYLEDALVPYFLPTGGSSFYVNCHIFQIGYEQPLVIVFKLKDDSKDVRYVEEHHFLRFDNFPATLNLKSKHVFRRGEMQLKLKIPEYFPTSLAKALHFADFDEKSHPVKKTIRDFMKKVTPLNHENICDVFEFLVEMEDYALSKLYEKLSRKKVRVEGCASDYSLKIVNILESQMPDTILSRGDRVILSCKGGRKGNNDSIRKIGAITSVIGDRIYFETKSGKIPIELSYDVAFEPQRLNFIYQHNALQQLRGDFYLRARLFPENSIGRLPASISLEYYNMNVAENPEQKEAVENIVGNNNKQVPFIVFGPPGTGKTTLIVEAILQLWKKSKDYRLLVMAGSNAACDVIASRLCKILNDIDPSGLNLLRVYATSYESKSENIHEDVLEASNLCYGQHFYPAIDTIYSYPIVIATLSVAGRFVHAQIKNNHFTHIFIDECGASTEPECLVGLSGILSSSGHLIISGDHKQLGPIIQCQRAAEYGLDKSLLERLMDCECYKQHPATKDYNRSIQARLIRNFRSHKDILALSNQLYYNNELKVMASPEITDIAIGWSGLRCKSFPMVFESIKGTMRKLKTSTSSCNYEELDAVILRVKELMFFGMKNNKINQEDIGVISPYKMQCQLIRRELDRRGWFHIETGSVETFQGQEKPVIIASMVRSQVDTPGFLDSPKRLNVLLTRAQALLILIGNPDTLKKIGDWKYVVEYCLENKAMMGARLCNSDDESNESGFTSITQNLQNLTIKDDRNLTKRSKMKQHVDASSNKKAHSNKDNIQKKIPDVKAEKSKENIKKGEENNLEWIEWLEGLPNVIDLFGTSTKTCSSASGSTSSNQEHVSKSPFHNDHSNMKVNKNRNTKGVPKKIKAKKQGSTGSHSTNKSPFNAENARNLASKKIYSHKPKELLTNKGAATSKISEKHTARQDLFLEYRRSNEHFNSTAGQFPSTTQTQRPSLYTASGGTLHSSSGPRQDLFHENRRSNENFNSTAGQFPSTTQTQRPNLYTASGGTLHSSSGAPLYYNCDPFAGPNNRFRMPIPPRGNYSNYSYNSGGPPVCPPLGTSDRRNVSAANQRMPMANSRFPTFNPNSFEDSFTRVYPKLPSSTSSNMHAPDKEYMQSPNMYKNTEKNPQNVVTAPQSTGVYPKSNRSAPKPSAPNLADISYAASIEKQQPYNPAFSSMDDAKNKKAKDDNCVLS